MKIQFLPGCFDNFDGTQEELDDFVAAITDMVETGEIFELSSPIDLDQMLEEDTEQAIAIMKKMRILEDLLRLEDIENKNDVTYQPNLERRVH